MGWKTKNPGVPSGLTQTWSFWRHCCCRYGWYPLLLAPLITVAVLFDIYAFFGCEFIHVEVGFTPSNASWNQSSMNVGLFQYEDVLGEVDDSGNAIGDSLWKECHQYSTEFQDQFIDGDRTWTVSRVMAYISASAGIVGAATIWLFVVTPVPDCFFWPAVMMPSLMIAFLASGSKFLFFDTSICRSSLWYPSGEDSLPRAAESCGLGNTAYFSIAASASFLVSLIITCLKSPERRLLKQDYGAHHGAGYEDAEYADGGSERSYEDRSEFVLNAQLSGMDAANTFDEEAAPQVSFANSSVVMGMSKEYDDTRSEPDESVTSMYLQDASSSDTTSTGEGRGTAGSGQVESGLDESLYNPRKSGSGSPSDMNHKESTERLAKMEEIQQATASDSDELIDKCVADLERQFME